MTAIKGRDWKGSNKDLNNATETGLYIIDGNTLNIADIVVSGYLTPSVDYISYRLARFWSTVNCYVDIHNDSNMINIRCDVAQRITIVFFYWQ